MVFPVPEPITPETLAAWDEDENEDLLEEELSHALRAAYEHKVAELTDGMMQQAERQVMLLAVDQQWQRHLTDLDMLREGVGLMGIAQRDPLVEYKRGSFEMWETMQDRVRQQAAQTIFRVRVNQPQIVQRRPVTLIHGGEATAPEKPKVVVKSSSKKPGRNDPCWCGSGKKYKACHLHADQQLENVR
jgi:preprotein translocase subunit SecA